MAHRGHRAARRAAVRHDHGPAVRPGHQHRRRCSRCPATSTSTSPAATTKNRINAAFFKGPDVLIKTVTESLGIPIHHYVEVDFQGFKRIVDAIGGVSLWFDAPVRDAQHRPERQRDRLREARRPARRSSTPGRATSRPRSTAAGARTAPATSGASAASRTSSAGPSRRPCSTGVEQPAGAQRADRRRRRQPARRRRASTSGPSPTASRSLQGAQLASYTIPADGQVRQGQRRADHERRSRPSPILDYFRGAGRADQPAAERDRRHHGGRGDHRPLPTTGSRRRRAAAPPTTSRPIGTVPGADKQCG